MGFKGARTLGLVVGTSALIAGQASADIMTSGDVSPGDLSSGVTVGGDFTTPGSGSVTIDEGSTVTTGPIPDGPFVTLAPLSGSSGDVTVTGAGSTWRVEEANSAGGAFYGVGRTGTGVLTIEDGGRVELDAMGADLDRTGDKPFPAGFQLGRNATGDGTVRISGSGSELSVTSPFATGFVGLRGQGRMTVDHGGLLSFSGINGDLNVASDLDSVSSGQGTLNVSSGGRIEGPVFLNVGGQPGGNGTVNVDGAASSITLTGQCPPSNCPTGFSFPNQGAFMSVGANEGTGEVNVTNGASILIDSSGAPDAEFPGFSLGAGSILGPEGDGTLTVDGVGSEVRVRGNEQFFSVGRLRDGKGTLNIRNGGQVVLENGDGESLGFVGDRTGAEGDVNIDGASSLLDAGNFLGIGVDTRDATQPGGNGTVTLSNGGTVKADHLYLNKGGTLRGNGTVTGSTSPAQVRVNLGGTIEPGLSPGEIAVEGDVTLADGGTILLEANSLSGFDKLAASGDIILNGGAVDILLGFLPDPGELLDINTFLADADGLLGGDALGTAGLFNVFKAPGSDVRLGSEVTLAVNDRTFTQNVNPVPVPATLLILLSGLAGLALAGRAGGISVPVRAHSAGRAAA